MIAAGDLVNSLFFSSFTPKNVHLIDTDSWDPATQMLNVSHPERDKTFWDGDGLIQADYAFL